MSDCPTASIQAETKKHGTSFFHHDGDYLTMSAQITVPDTLILHLQGLSTGNLRLVDLNLGGLSLHNKILDQICHYTDVDGNQQIMREWHKDGTVMIDFFAKDWLQYHMIYGNKFYR